jgi:hypothetical protein
VRWVYRHRNKLSMERPRSGGLESAGAIERWPLLDAAPARAISRHKIARSASDRVNLCKKRSTGKYARRKECERTDVGSYYSSQCHSARSEEPLMGCWSTLSFQRIATFVCEILLPRLRDQDDREWTAVVIRSVTHKIHQSLLSFRAESRNLLM